MEIDLNDTVALSSLPQGFVWVPWDERLMEQHAEVKYRSFIGEESMLMYFPASGIVMAVGV